MRNRSYPDLPKVTVSIGARISAFAFFFVCHYDSDCPVGLCPALLHRFAQLAYATPATHPCLQLLYGICDSALCYQRVSQPADLCSLHRFCTHFLLSSIHCDKASKVLLHCMVHFSKLGDQCCALVPWVCRQLCR